VASLSQGRTAAAQCGLFTHKSVPVIFEPPCTLLYITLNVGLKYYTVYYFWLKGRVSCGVPRRVNFITVY